MTQVNLIYPVYNTGEPQRAEGEFRNTPPKVSRLSLICLIAQEFPFAECPDIPVAQG